MLTVACHLICFVKKKTLDFKEKLILFAFRGLKTTLEKYKNKKIKIWK